MRETSPYPQDQAQRRKKFGKRKKNRNRAATVGGGERNGHVARSAQDAASPGVCIKCGHPAPDGKLCNFHRSLLNSIRNDFGDVRVGRGPTPNYY